MKLRFLLIASLPAAAWAGPVVLSPASGGLVLGGSAVLSVEACRGGLMQDRVLLDGNDVAVSWNAGPNHREWTTRLPLAGEGTHRVEIPLRCGKKTKTLSTDFTSRRRGSLAPGIELARAYMAKHPAKKEGWDWGPAVFQYGLAEVAATAPADFATDADTYLTAYHERWQRKGPPAIDRSDRVAPSLSAIRIGHLNALYGVDYVRHEARNRLGTLDHLGHSALRIFYPHTIWVDSLMMYGVLAARWGRVASEPALLDFGAEQPLRFADVLQDPASGLFRHAWRIHSKRSIPESATYWLRGNGWVLVSIAEILDQLDAQDPRREALVRVFTRLVDGLKPYQQADGLWDSLANLPGATFPETSGSVLVAYAVAKAVHRGWLPAAYLDLGRRAFVGVTARLERKKGVLSLPLVSGPTNPGARWTYKLVPPRRDLPYGVGPYLLAAQEFASEEFP